jgi:quinol monooxygenase YgiN
VAAGVILLGASSALRWHLGSPTGEDLTPALLWPDPIVVHEPGDDAGPVLVTIDYVVADADREEFHAVLQELSDVRRRDGAVRWRLYRDPAAPGRFVEVFEVGSWREHLLQHERLPRSDEALVRRATELGGGGAKPVVRHLIGTDDGGLG